MVRRENRCPHPRTARGRHAGFFHPRRKGIPALGIEGVEISAQASLKGKVRTFFSTFWPVYSDKRSVLVFVDVDDRILVKRFSDSPAVPGPEKKVD